MSKKVIRFEYTDGTVKLKKLSRWSKQVGGIGFSGQGEYANIANLKSVTIPEGITRIG